MTEALPSTQERGVPILRERLPEELPTFDELSRNVGAYLLLLADDGIESSVLIADMNRAGIDFRRSECDPGATTFQIPSLHIVGATFQTFQTHGDIYAALFALFPERAELIVDTKLPLS